MSDLMTPAVDGGWRANKLCRVPGPNSYRLMAVNLRGEPMIGQTSGRLSLEEDIAAYRSSSCRPLYAVFVRPALATHP